MRQVNTKVAQKSKSPECKKQVYAKIVRVNKRMVVTRFDCEQLELRRRTCDWSENDGEEDDDDNNDYENENEGSGCRTTRTSPLVVSRNGMKSGRCRTDEKSNRVRIRGNTNIYLSRQPWDAACTVEPFE